MKLGALESLMMWVNVTSTGEHSDALLSMTTRSRARSSSVRTSTDSIAPALQADDQSMPFPRCLMTEHRRTQWVSP